jgi:hypothetical protein
MIETRHVARLISCKGDAPNGAAVRAGDRIGKEKYFYLELENLSLFQLAGLFVM